MSCLIDCLVGLVVASANTEHEVPGSISGSGKDRNEEFLSKGRSLD